MTLGRLALRLERRLISIQAAIDASFLGPKTTGKLEKWALQEGYVSQTWQAWCSFCRDLIINSALGTPTSANLPVHSPHVGRAIPELTWIGMRGSKGENINIVKSLGHSRLEPTWGDTSKFQDTISPFQLSNEQQILTGVLSAGLYARHLQTVRNASAHITKDNMLEVRGLAQFYSPSPIIAPSDAIFWHDDLGEFIYRRWTARFILAANQAVS